MISMKKRSILGLALMFILTAGIAVAVQTNTTDGAKQASQSATQMAASPSFHHELGTISSLTASELILDHTSNGKAEKTKFTLLPDAKKEGNIKQGERVIVYYRFEKGQRIATELKAFSWHQGPALRPRPENPSS
jgi:hypothetical protein